MFKNKHVIVAMIVAPILAVISYFATDYMVSEKPHKIANDNVYKMRVKSNCRWESGKCTIDNGDVDIDITGKYINTRELKIYLNSSVALNGIKIAFDKNNARPTPMNSYKNDNFKWETTLNTSEQTKNLNLAISIDKGIFFAQIPTIFLTKQETIYGIPKTQD